MFSEAEIENNADSGMRPTYGAKLLSKTSHIRYLTFPACSALYFQNRPKKLLLTCTFIFKLKQNTLSTGVNQMTRKKLKSK